MAKELYSECSSIPWLFLVQKSFSMGAHLAQCARNAAIWVSGHTRNPRFVILWASLLFHSRFCGFFHIGDLAFLDFHPISPISSLFTHVLLISTTFTPFWVDF